MCGGGQTWSWKLEIQIISLQYSSTSELVYPWSLSTFFTGLTWWDQSTPANMSASSWSRASEPPCWSSRWDVCATAGWDWGPCRIPLLPPVHTVCCVAAKTQQCSKTTSHPEPDNRAEKLECKCKDSVKISSNYYEFTLVTNHCSASYTLWWLKQLKKKLCNFSNDILRSSLNLRSIKIMWTFLV